MTEIHEKLEKCFNVIKSRKEIISQNNMSIKVNQNKKQIRKIKKIRNWAKPERTFNYYY